MCHVRLLLIDSQVFAEEVEPTGAVPMELSLERYRYAALHSNKTGGSGSSGGVGSGPMMPSIPGMTEDDKRLQPRLTVNMFPGSQLLRNDKLHLQSVLNGWYVIGTIKSLKKLSMQTKNILFLLTIKVRYAQTILAFSVSCLNPWLLIERISSLL